MRQIINNQIHKLNGDLIAIYHVAYNGKNNDKKIVLRNLFSQYGLPTMQMEEEIKIKYGFHISKQFEELSEYEINCYLELYKKQILDRVANCYYNLNLGETADLESNKQSGNLEQENKCSISDVLNLIDYGTQIIKLDQNIDSSSVEEILIILKTADLLLNNRPCDKPKKKSLHLMNNVFCKIGSVDPKIQLLSSAMIDLFVKE